MVTPGGLSLRKLGSGKVLAGRKPWARSDHWKRLLTGLPRADEGGDVLCLREPREKATGASTSRALPSRQQADAGSSDVGTHALLQSLLHVEERVGDAADFSQDLGAQLLVVLEHPVHVKRQEVLGHTAHI